MASREDSIGALRSLGVLIPPNSKLSEDELQSRLQRAIDSAQRLQDVSFGFSLDVDILRKFPEEDGRECKLETILQQILVETNFDADALEEHQTLLELSQTVAQLFINYDGGKRICVIQDSEQQSAIVLQVRHFPLPWCAFARYLVDAQQSKP